MIKTIRTYFVFTFYFLTPFLRWKELEAKLLNHKKYKYRCMYIYVFSLSFNVFKNIVLVSLPFYLVLSCHGIRILCRMPLFLTFAHVQNDFLWIPSFSFLGTVLFHYKHLIMADEVMNSFSVKKPKKQSFDTQKHMTF